MLSRQPSSILSSSLQVTEWPQQASTVHLWRRFVCCASVVVARLHAPSDLAFLRLPRIILCFPAGDPNLFLTIQSGTESVASPRASDVLLNSTARRNRPALRGTATRVISLRILSSTVRGGLCALGACLALGTACVVFGSVTPPAPVCLVHGRGPFCFVTLADRFRATRGERGNCDGWFDVFVVPDVPDVRLVAALGPPGGPPPVARLGEISPELPEAVWDLLHSDCCCQPHGRSWAHGGSSEVGDLVRPWRCVPSKGLWLAHQASS